MPALRDLQSAFARSLLDPARPVPAAVTSHTARQPKKRFDVYRNNVYFGLIEALAAQFPAIARLLGKDMFVETAKAYIAEHPPTSPLLFRYGETFGDFLAQAKPLEDYPYLGDVARLEWLWMQAYHGADQTPLNPAELGAIPADQLDGVRFDLHPTMRLLSSPHPIVSIWHTNIVDEEVAPVDLAQGGDDALIMRPTLDVEIQRLRPGAMTLLSHLAQGETLERASAAAAENSDEFDIERVLTDLLQSSLITGFVID
jgi:hypothetical protein